MTELESLQQQNQRLIDKQEEIEQQNYELGIIEGMERVAKWEMEYAQDEFKHYNNDIAELLRKHSQYYKQEATNLRCKYDNKYHTNIKKAEHE